MWASGHQMGCSPQSSCFRSWTLWKKLPLLISHLKYQLAYRLRHPKSCLIKGISLAYWQLLYHPHSEMKLPCGKVTVSTTCWGNLHFTHKREFLSNLSSSTRYEKITWLPCSKIDTPKIQIKKDMNPLSSESILKVLHTGQIGICIATHTHTHTHKKVKTCKITLSVTISLLQNKVMKNIMLTSNTTSWHLFCQLCGHLIFVIQKVQGPQIQQTAQGCS